MPSALDDTHLSDLHALAAKLGVERYRLLPREELAAAILERDPDAAAALPEKPEKAEPAPSRERRPEGSRAGRDRGRGGRRSRGDERGRGRERSDTDDEGDDEPDEPGEPVTGILDITPRGHGFIRLSGLEGTEEDVYVSPSQIRRCEMRRGDEVSGPARPPRRGERYPALVHVDKLNGVEPGDATSRLAEATPVHPSRRIDLKPGPDTSAEDAILLRSLDLLWPLAHGQRVLIDAVPGSGRTTLLRALARSLAARDDLELVVLLIDERPEEAEAWREAAPDAELAIATGDMRTGEQLRLVELAFGRATRRAEAGTDVVLLVDSLSRVAAAADDPGRVKPIFGAGRQTSDESLGALTVVATVLRGDDESGVASALETTESSLIVLDADLAAAGLYPAIDIPASRISGEEELREGDELTAARALRSELGSMSSADASAALRERLERSADNAALLGSPAS